MMNAKPETITNNYPAASELSHDLPTQCVPSGKIRHWLGSVTLAFSLSLLAACGGGGGGGDEEPAASTPPPATAQTPSQPTETAPLPETPTQTPAPETPSTSQTEGTTTPPSTSIVDTVIDTVTETVKEVVNTITETVKETVQTVVEAVTPTPPPSQTTTTTETTPTTTETNTGNTTSNETSNPPATTEPEPTTPSTPVYTASTAYDHIYDNRIGLGSDANGIPILAKHSDAQFIYWNPSHANANDNNAGTSADAPKKTLNNAWKALRDGYGDWLVMAKGSFFDEGFGGLATRSGLNSQYPIVVTTYDPADPTNFNKMRTGTVTLGKNPTADLMKFMGFTGNNIVFENIIFKKNTANNDYGIAYYSTSSHSMNMLFHNVSFLKTPHSWMGGSAGTVSPERVSDVIYRHCVFAYAQSSGHAQGLYLWKTNNFTIEDSVLYHNGWSDDGSRDSATYKPDIFKHNAYFGTMTFNTIFRRNVSGDASSHGLQLRGGGIANENVFINNPINVLIGGGDNYNMFQPSGISYQFNNNVIIGSTDINSSNPRGFGLLFENTKSGGSADNNIIANIGNTSSANIYAIRSTWMSAQFDVPTYFNLTNSIIWNWNPNYITQSYDNQRTLSGSLAFRAYPNKLYWSYSNNIIHFDTAPDSQNKQAPLTPFPNPNRDINSFSTMNGYGSEDALWQNMIANPKTKWASLIGDHIRAGFAR